VSKMLYIVARKNKLKKNFLVLTAKIGSKI